MHEKSRELEVRWQSEKNIITNIREHKRKVEELKQSADIAERRGDLQRVAEIRYGQIPAVEQALAREEEHLSHMQRSGRRILKEEVTDEDIAAVVARWTGIPVTKMLENEAKKLISMEAELAHMVVGQSEALQVVSNAIRRSRAGISEPSRPIGSFIFMGPTGVGKTELARALATFLFNDANALIRIDMSEYMESHSTSKIIGSPPGYVGFEEGGQITEKIRRKPYAVLLFDEVEKAHPDVFNIMLQILDDGRLTDAKGRVVSFKNTIVIMTSNMGSDIILDAGTKKTLGFSSSNDTGDSIDTRVTEQLKNYFKPEFLNRVDEVVVFHSLKEQDLRQIVDIQLSHVQERLREKDISITVTDTAKKWLAKRGFDPQFGARPLKRVIQKELLDPLSLALIKGTTAAGAHVVIDATPKKLLFKLQN